MSQYHTPVLLKESIDGLVCDPDGAYIDVTFGGGGHSREILNRLSPKGQLIAFDQDEDAVANAKYLEAEDRFQLVPTNFQFIQNHLKAMGIGKVTGILGDLGVSSHQFDKGQRGFTFRIDAPLDMRMNQRKENTDPTAAQWLEAATVDEMASVFRKYGEVGNAGSVAHAIITERGERPIKTTGQLKELLEKVAPKKKATQFFAQVFQAIRIHINVEMRALENLLQQSEQLIAEGGRLVIISYHSLEDRLTKNFIRSGNLDGKQEKDFYGNLLAPFKPTHRKVIVPSEAEIEANPRARSAKLRIAERI